MLNKQDLLNEYRFAAESFLQQINEIHSKNEKAQKMNIKIQLLRQEFLSKYTTNNSTLLEKLENTLLITYSSYVIMLEYRNKVWEYEYMAFSRRIGEIWEPICKIPFEYPVNELTIYEAPNFDLVQEKLKEEISEFIDTLTICNSSKSQLNNYYDMIWHLVDSGNISLKLDLHLKKDNIYYDIDYKSGFSSNEKGNTNRLLLVASIYHSLPDTHKNLIFVRQTEEENNHYLQTLKNSTLWDVYCADDAYAKIKELSGFDIKSWMINNIDWQNDISEEFKSFLINHDLLKYLTW